jgi:hypothetical protein
VAPYGVSHGGRHGGSREEWQRQYLHVHVAAPWNMDDWRWKEMGCYLIFSDILYMYDTYYIYIIMNTFDGMYIYIHM